MTKNTKATRQTVNTGTVWEEVASFSRGLRVGQHIFIAGTTASGPNGIVGKDDPAQQMQFILERIEGAIQQLGGRLENIVRTRIYVSEIKHWESVARIHGEKFKNIRPVCTLVEAHLVGECLVEVEAEAIVDDKEF